MEGLFAIRCSNPGTIGERLKTTRLKQNITQDSLAASSSISRSSVQNIEAGEIKSFDAFLRI